MAKQRIIWTNDNFDEWLEEMKREYGSEFDDDEFDYGRYCEDCSLFLDDERANLNVDVDGYIVAFAVLGLWDGLHNGAKPYLVAMLQLTSITDKYMFDGADDIVRYFLSNASTWKGETARRVKKELNEMLKHNK